MKYTDYTPNRTTHAIRQDMAMIQSIRSRSEANKRRTKRNLSDVACQAISALLYTSCAASVLYLGYIIIKK